MTSVNLMMMEFDESIFINIINSLFQLKDAAGSGAEEH